MLIFYAHLWFDIVRLDNSMQIQQENSNFKIKNAQNIVKTGNSKKYFKMTKKSFFIDLIAFYGFMVGQTIDSNQNNNIQRYNTFKKWLFLKARDIILTRATVYKSPEHHEKFKSVLLYHNYLSNDYWGTKKTITNHSEVQKP